MVWSGQEDPGGGVFKAMIVRVCDVVLPAVLLWEVGDMTKPATVAAGLVLALQAAALRS